MAGMPDIITKSPFLGDLDWLSRTAPYPEQPPIQVLDFLLVAIIADSRVIVADVGVVPTCKLRSVLNEPIILTR